MGWGFWVAVAVAAILFLFVFPTLVMSYVIYSVLFVRTKPEKWDRGCSLPEDKEYLNMHNQGLEWGEKYSGYKLPVGIVSDGFKLCGEFFNFGCDRAVIIIAGRMEACLYSYYFAEPYRRSGYNVLVIDNRSHGLSEGKVNSLGYKEYRDILRWGKLLHDEYNCAEIYLHGICIGSSTALFALTSPDCPEYFSGMTADGMYATFYESFRNHMVLDKRPLFPFLWEVMLHIRVFSGANVVTDGPIKRMGLLKKPILFLHSKEDVFSVPEKALLLYNDCQAPKKLVWFDKGAHSRLRINSPEKYDGAIEEFLSENINLKNTAVTSRGKR